MQQGGPGPQSSAVPIRLIGRIRPIGPIVTSPSGRDSCREQKQLPVSCRVLCQE